MHAALRTRIRCLVCDFTEVRTDEVIDRGVVLLHECPRCDHRWTTALTPERGPRRAVAVPRPSARSAA